MFAKRFTKYMTIAQIKATKEYITAQCGITDFQIGLVMGTGLEAMKEKINVTHIIPYTDIPNFPTATVSFHKGQLLIGTIGNKQVVAMQGRFHYYEGYSMQQITFPIRVMAALGISTLLVSNAAGGMNPLFKKGDLMVIEDHINMLPDNPLRGISDPQFGERFVDMCAPYNEILMQKFLSINTAENITVHKGIYVSVMGPNLETKAEYRWLRSTGADAVGMSTVPEIIVANQCGLQCLAVSVITDECDPDNLKPVNIAEIIAVAGKSDLVFSTMLSQLIENL